MPRLRVSAGSDPNALADITNLVNTNKPSTIASDLFDGKIVVNIKGFTTEDGEPGSSAYFDQDERQGITWSFQVQGRFLKNYSADDVLFGNTFDRPLQLPWGSGAALKFMNFVDPTLEHDLTSSTKPWALSPLISTMPHFMHTRICGGSPESSPSSSTSSLELPSMPPKFPPSHPIADDNSMLHLAHVPSEWSPSSSPSSSSSSLSSTHSYSSVKSNKSRLSLKYKNLKRGGGSRSNQGPINLQNAIQRRTYFSSPENRRSVMFGSKDIISIDFCYGFLEFSPTISLRLPGGLSFDLMRYWDGQPVRFVCCERKRPGDEGTEPWGRILWCVVIDLCD